MKNLKVLYVMILLIPALYSAHADTQLIARGGGGGVGRGGGGGFDRGGEGFDRGNRDGFARGFEDGATYGEEQDNQEEAPVYVDPDDDSDQLYDYYLEQNQE